MEQFFFEKGLLGVLVLALAYVVIILYKKQERKQRDQDKKYVELEVELKVLRGRFDKYMEEDRKELLEALNNNTGAFHDVTDALKKTG